MTYISNKKSKTTPFSAWEEDDIEYNLENNNHSSKQTLMERKPSKNQLRRFNNVDELKNEIKLYDTSVLNPTK